MDKNSEEPRCHSNRVANLDCNVTEDAHETLTHNNG